MSLLKANKVQLLNNERIIFENNDVLSKYEIQTLLQTRTDLFKNTIDNNFNTLKSIYNKFLNEDEDTLDNLESIEHIEMSECNFSFTKLHQDLKLNQDYISTKMHDKIDKVNQLSLSNKIPLLSLSIELYDNIQIVNDKIELMKEHILPFVVEQNGNTWIPMGNYLKGKRHINQEFGNQISMSQNGQRIFVLSGAHNSIQLYQFDVTQQDWELIHEHNDSHRYYHSISLSKDGNRYVIGDPYADDVRGHVKVYEFYDRKNEWRQIGGTIMGLQYGSKMGYNVKMNFDGTHICISSIRYNNNDEEIGMVTQFKYNEITNQWIQLGQNLESTQPYQYFGKSLAIDDSGKCIAIGDPIDNENKGSVYVYEYNNQSNKWIIKGQIHRGENAMDSIGEKDTIAINKDGTILIISSIQKTQIYQYSDYFKSWNQIGNLEEGGKIVGINNLGNNIILGKDGFVFIYEYIHYEWKMTGEFQGDGLYGKCVAIDSTGNIIAISAPKNKEGIVLLYKKKQKNYLTMDSTHVLRDLVNHIIEEKELSYSDINFKFNQYVDKSNRLFKLNSESFQKHSDTIFNYYKIVEENQINNESKTKLNNLSTNLDSLHISLSYLNDSIEQEFIKQNNNHHNQFKLISDNIDQFINNNNILNKTIDNNLQLLENTIQDNYDRIDNDIDEKKLFFSKELYIIYNNIIGTSIKEDNKDNNYNKLYVNKYFALGQYWRIAVYRHTLLFEYNDNPKINTSWKPIQPYFVKPFNILDPKIVEKGTLLFEQSFKIYLDVKKEFSLIVAYKAGFLAEYNCAMSFFVMQYIIDNINDKEIYIDTEDSKYEIKKITNQNNNNAYLYVDILIGKNETNKFEIIINDKMYSLYYFHAIMVDTPNLINYH